MSDYPQLFNEYARYISLCNELQGDDVVTTCAKYFLRWYWVKKCGDIYTRSGKSDQQAGQYFMDVFNTVNRIKEMNPILGQQEGRNYFLKFISQQRSEIAKLEESHRYEDAINLIYKLLDYLEVAILFNDGNKNSLSNLRLRYKKRVIELSKCIQNGTTLPAMASSMIASQAPRAPQAQGAPFSFPPMPAGGIYGQNASNDFANEPDAPQIPALPSATPFSFPPAPVSSAPQPGIQRGNSQNYFDPTKSSIPMKPGDSGAANSNAYGYQMEPPQIPGMAIPGMNSLSSSMNSQFQRPGVSPPGASPSFPGMDKPSSPVMQPMFPGPSPSFASPNPPFPGMDKPSFPGMDKPSFPGMDKPSFPSNKPSFPGMDMPSFPSSNPSFPGMNKPSSGGGFVLPSDHGGDNDFPSNDILPKKPEPVSLQMSSLQRVPSLPTTSEWENNVEEMLTAYNTEAQKMAQENPKVAKELYQAMINACQRDRRFAGYINQFEQCIQQLKL